MFCDHVMLSISQINIHKYKEEEKNVDLKKKKGYITEDQPRLLNLH